MLGYTQAEGEAIVAHIADRNTVVGAPAIKPEHLAVFDCAMGDRAIDYNGHVSMMGAVQPFISGAISKTANMPESATVEDVAKLYLDSWKMGVKALAIYRDNCKVAQPMGAKQAELVHKPMRKTMPIERMEIGRKFQVGEYEGYIHVGLFPDGTPGDVFVDIAKEGTTLAGLMNALMISVSLGLQYGVPLDVYVSKFSHMRFEPSGLTNDPGHPRRQVARRLHLPVARQEVPRRRDAGRARHHVRRGARAPAGPARPRPSRSPTARCTATSSPRPRPPRRAPSCPSSRPASARSSTPGRTPRSARSAAAARSAPARATRAATAATTPAAADASGVRTGFKSRMAFGGLESPAVCQSRAVVMMRLLGWARDRQTCGDPGLAHGAERPGGFAERIPALERVATGSSSRDPLPLASSRPTTHGTFETSSKQPEGVRGPGGPRTASGALALTIGR